VSQAPHASEDARYAGAQQRNANGLSTGIRRSSGRGCFESKSWFFGFDDREQVVAFYQQQLPNAAREDEEDEVRFKFTPTGAEDGEDVSVVVRKDELQISEVVKSGKRKA
jgi:hypothetical protein